MLELGDVAHRFGFVDLDPIFAAMAPHNANEDRIAHSGVARSFADVSRRPLRNPDGLRHGETRDSAEQLRHAIAACPGNGRRMIEAGTPGAVGDLRHFRQRARADVGVGDVVENGPRAKVDRRLPIALHVDPVQREALSREIRRQIGGASEHETGGPCARSIRNDHASAGRHAHHAGAVVGYAEEHVQPDPLPSGGSWRRGGQGLAVQTHWDRLASVAEGPP